MPSPYAPESGPGAPCHLCPAKIRGQDPMPPPPSQDQALETLCHPHPAVIRLWRPCTTTALPARIRLWRPCTVLIQPLHAGIGPHATLCMPNLVHSAMAHMTPQGCVRNPVGWIKWHQGIWSMDQGLSTPVLKDCYSHFRSNCTQGLYLSVFDQITTVIRFIPSLP